LIENDEVLEQELSAVMDEIFSAEGLFHGTFCDFSLSG
jgi:hypothetical protein